MQRSYRRGCLLGMLAIGVGCGAAFAEGDTAAAKQNSNDDKLARLESLLEAQQQQIRNLEQQVSAAGASSTDAARVEIMRQQIREVLSETGFRESLMQSTVMAGYDDGFFIQSSDDKFKLQINGQLQFRWTHYGTRSSNRYLRPRHQRNDRTGFDVQRLRLKFTGHAYGPDLTYAIWLRAEAVDGYDFALHYAWVNYKMRDELQFKAGIFRLASTRSQMMNDENFNMIDRPVVDAVFGLGIGLGVRVWGQLFDKKLDYYLDVVNSLNSPANRTITTDPAEHDNNPAILFRLVWHVMGDDPATDFAAEADIPKHDSPALDFGFHYAFNEDDGDLGTTRIPFGRRRALGTGGGGFGLTNTNGLQINQFGIDAAFKYQGFSLITAYTIRIVDVRQGSRPFAPLFILTADDSTTVMHGAYLQMGYFLPIPGLEDKLEAVVRVGGISTNNGGQEGTWEYAAGINYYIEGNKVKLQTDVTKVSEVPISNNYSSLANVNDDALIWRIQLQFAF